MMRTLIGRGGFKGRKETVTPRNNQDLERTALNNDWLGPQDD